MLLYYNKHSEIKKLHTNQKKVLLKNILAGASENVKQTIQKIKPNIIFKYQDKYAYLHQNKLFILGDSSFWKKVKKQLKVESNIVQMNEPINTTSIIKIKIFIPRDIITKIIKSLFASECNETSGVFVMSKINNNYIVNKIIKQYYSKNKVSINKLNKENNEFSSYHTHPLSCMNSPDYKCSMGWPSQNDFVLCFGRSFGIFGLIMDKKLREPFSLVFTHEGYYITQVNVILLKACSDLLFDEIKELQICVDKTIDKFQIEEEREIKNKNIPKNKYSYNMDVGYKNGKIKTLQNKLNKVTFKRCLKYTKNTKYEKLLSNTDIPVFKIKFVPYNQFYNSRQSLNNTMGQSLVVRKSMI